MELQKPKKPLLSICVPTYNRAKLLRRLYRSIVEQNFWDIELIVVDDGSSDDTRCVVQNWVKNALFTIKYVYQTNSGRAMALKKAILKAEGHYTIIMDDDDCFKPNSFKSMTKLFSIVERMNSLGSKKRRIVGICGLCEDEHGNLIGTKFPEDFIVSDFVKLRANYKVIGDKKEVVQTEVLRSVLYDAKERRVPTSLLWTRVAKDYDILFVNEIFVKKVYLEGGMTRANLKLKFRNPCGMYLLYRELLEYINRGKVLSKSFKAKVLLKYMFWKLYLNLKGNRSACN